MTFSAKADGRIRNIREDGGTDPFIEGRVQAIVRNMVRRYGLGYQEDDLWQEIRLKFWGKIDTCTAESEGSLCGWIQAITHRHCRNVLRATARTIPLDECPDLDLVSTSEPASGFGEYELRKTLARALKNKFERTVIELRYVHDYTPTEIGEMLGKSVHTVNMALLRAKEHLRDHFLRASRNGVSAQRTLR